MVVETYLFDQHVEVLGDVGCQACNVTLSVIEDQSRGFAAAIWGDEACGFPQVMCNMQSHISLLHAHLARRRGLRIPFDLRILRILLPAPSSQQQALKQPFSDYE
jgi:hypothetical protein